MPSTAGGGALTVGARPRGGGGTRDGRGGAGLGARCPTAGPRLGRAHARWPWSRGEYLALQTSRPSDISPVVSACACSRRGIFIRPADWLRLGPCLFVCLFVL